MASIIVVYHSGFGHTKVQAEHVLKGAAGFTNSGGLSGNRQMTLSYLMAFAAQHLMIWVSLGQMAVG